MPVDAQTRLVALLGYPVAHSLSPLMHNAAFTAQDLNWLYVTTPVRPADLQEAVSGLKALNFAGANVTIPHKVNVIPWLDEVTERAQHVGAVNTIVVKEGQDKVRLLGDNTDIAGFLKPLSPYRAALEGSSMLIFGSGGAARAVIYGLLTTCHPSKLVIAARSLAKAEQLALDMSPHDSRGALHVMSMQEASDLARTSGLVVNATPVGMEPDIDSTPWPSADDFSSDHIVYDLVYNPRETRLLREAAQQGAHTIGGLEMLIAQAAAAYEQWTGQAMLIETVRSALGSDAEGPASSSKTDAGRGDGQNRSVEESERRE